MSLKSVLKVLVFPAGTEIGLEIYHALSMLKEIKLYGANLDISNHAPYVFAHYFTLPSIFAPNFIDSLNILLEQQEIRGLPCALLLHL